MDFSKWGTITKVFHNITQVNKDNIKYEIEKYDTHQIVKIYSNNILVTSFVDTFGINNESFLRKYKNEELLIINGQIKLKKVVKNVSYIESIKKAKKISHKFITLDIETKVIDNVLVPYCICMFDGKNKYSFYISDYNNSEEMLVSAISSLLRYKYNNYVVYAHNMSGFDGVFLLKVLSKTFDTKVIIRDDKIIQFNLEYNINPKKKGKLIFRDSYLMLPISLRKLADSFEVENKGHFPHEFVNGVPLDYIGDTPEFKYWEDLTLEEYNQLISNKWSIREEVIKYCIQDCVTLYQIIDKFSQLVFDKWQINIHKYPTLPSLAFAIYKANYMKNKIIPKINSVIYYLF